MLSLRFFLNPVWYKNLSLSLKFISLPMLLGCFWVFCVCLDLILNKFTLYAVLHSFGTSEFGIVVRYFLSDFLNCLSSIDF